MMGMQQLKNELAGFIEFDDFTSVLKSKASVQYPKSRSKLDGFKTFGDAARKNLHLAFSNIPSEIVTRENLLKEIEIFSGISNKLEIEEGLKEYGLETFFKPSTENKPSLIIVISGNMGFCGKYNRDVNFLAEELIEELSNKSKPYIITIGKKSTEYFSFSRQIPSDNKFVFPEKNEDEKKDLSNYILKKKILEPYLKREISQVFVIYDSFDDKSEPPRIQIKPVKVKLLPLGKMEIKKSDYLDRKMVFEPSPLICISYLIREYLFSLMMSYFFEAETSENYARMIAMNQASEAIKEAIDKKESEIRKTRQTQITKELVEIISGAEALKNREK